MIKPLERHPAAALWALYHEPRDKPLAIQVDPLEEESLVSDEFLKSFIANSLGFLVDSNGGHHRLNSHSHSRRDAGKVYL